MVAPFLLLAWGEQRTSAAMAGVLTGATPVLTLAWPPSSCAASGLRCGAVGLVLGFAGLLVMAPWSGRGGTFGGELACLGRRDLCGARRVRTQVPLRRGMPPIATPPPRPSWRGDPAALCRLGWDTPSVTWSGSSILLLGVLGSGWVRPVLPADLDVGATAASSVNYLVPFMSLIISAVVLGETISWNVLIGGVVIVVSILLGENQLRPGASATVRRR